MAGPTGNKRPVAAEAFCNSIKTGGFFCPDTSGDDATLLEKIPVCLIAIQLNQITIGIKISDGYLTRSSQAFQYALDISIQIRKIPDVVLAMSLELRFFSEK